MTKKNIVIVGGTSGLGLGVATLLDKDQYRVMIGGRSSPETLENISYNYIDVSREDSVESFVDTLNLTNLDALVYSAGIAYPKKSIQDFRKEEFDRIHRVNLVGAILVLKHFYQALKASKGRVVIVNSLAARTQSKFSSFEYTVTKSGLSGLVRQLSVEWAKEGIFINSIFPSMIKTNMLFENVSNESIENLKDLVPIGIVAEVEDIFPLIEFLVGDNNTYITGAGIDINGGLYQSS